MFSIVKYIESMITLFTCSTIHFNNIDDSASFKFIMLNMLLRDNKHGIDPN